MNMCVCVCVRECVFTTTVVLARVQIQLSDVSVQISYRTPDLTQEYFLRAKISR